MTISDAHRLALLDSALVDLKLDEGQPAGLDLTDADLADIARYDHKPRHRALTEQWKARKSTRDDIELNKAEGHTATENRKIDAHRAGEGKDAYNEKQRKRRHENALKEGRVVKPRKANPTKEERNAQRAASKKNRSLAQIEKEKNANTIARALKREAVKKAAVAAMEARPDFGKFG
jgi:hypothetical protein